MTIIELLTPAYEAAWLPWAVQYFFLIGIAATSALMAAALAFGKPGSACERLLPATVAVLFTAAIAAPVSLLADLHQPGRFWHFYAHPTPWSWMSIGAFLLPVFVVLAYAFAALWWLRRRALLRLVGVLMGLSALTILLYTGAEMQIVRARPLWHTVFLPINLALTGWLGSLGAALLVARWMPGGMAQFPVALTRRLALVAVAALAVVALVWLGLGLAHGEPSYLAAVKLFNEFGAWRLALVGSVLAGLVLMIWIWRSSHVSAASAYWLWLALALLAAAWVFRWIVFMAVQTVPKFGAGLYLQGISWGGDGVLGMLGVLGLVVAVLAIVTWLLDRFPPGSPLNFGRASA